jgi:ribonuclease BN (tRNA processing enzyme)
MYATPERACAGYLVDVDGTRLWMDAGSGTWQGLIDRVPFEALDGILLTHRHPDHTADVWMSYHARRWGSPEPLPSIPLWAPAETLERLLAYEEGLAESFELVGLEEGRDIAVGGARLSFVRMAHGPVTLGVRIALGDDVIAYSADSGPDADFDRLAGGAQVFLCEATLQDVDALFDAHLRASQAAEIAERVGAERLILTHLPPNRDLALSLAEAEKSSDAAKVQLAADGLRLEV